MVVNPDDRWQIERRKRQASVLRRWARRQRVRALHGQQRWIRRMVEAAADLAAAELACRSDLPEHDYEWVDRARARQAARARLIAAYLDRPLPAIYTDDAANDRPHA